MTGRGTGRVDLERLVADLRALRLPRRDLLVHCSLRRLGPPVGGADTLLGALRTVLGDEQTIVVPTQTDGNSTTSRRFRQATRNMNSPERAAYEARIEGFSPTMKSHTGAFAEHVRQQPGAVRSSHPQASFAAVGPRAVQLMAVHELDCHLGERSPLGALYRSDGYTLLLGVGYRACTALHLAEYRLPPPLPRRAYRCFTVDGGERVQHDFEAVDLDDRDFAELGEAIDRDLGVRCGPVGNAGAKIVPIRAAVDFAIGWLTRRRRI